MITVWRSPLNTLECIGLSQVLELLGARTAEDNKPVTKQKVKKEVVTAAVKESVIERGELFNVVRMEFNDLKTQ